jgi:hypothetical protein
MTCFIQPAPPLTISPPPDSLFNFESINGLKRSLSQSPYVSKTLTDTHLEMCALLILSFLNLVKPTVKINYTFVSL